jgi:hypothetical protein
MESSSLPRAFSASWRAFSSTYSHRAEISADESRIVAHEPNDRFLDENSSSLRRAREITRWIRQAQSSVLLQKN